MSKKTKKKKKHHKALKINQENQLLSNANTKNNLKIIITCFLLSRLILVIFLIINKDLSIFNIYDSIHYLKMAEFGYTTPKLYAFFPLYPLLIRTLSVIIPSYKISGALISNICSLLSLLILNKLTNHKDNRYNIICFVFSPILAFTSIVYTESLFMLLTILGYYLYKKDKYILSGLIVGLSILTRNSGIILCGAIGLDMLYRFFIKKENNFKFKYILIFGLISLSIGMIYPTYLYIKTGNFLEFASVQEEYWGRDNASFIHGIINDVKVIVRSKDDMFRNIVIFLQNWISFFAVLILGIKMFKKDKVSSIYTIMSLVAFTMTFRDISKWSTLSSISLFRYIFNLFPIYIYFLDNKKENTKIVIYMIFFLLSIYNTILTYLDIFMG